MAKNGDPLDTWFKDNKAITCPISLAASIPEGGLKILEQQAADLAMLRGTPLTIHDVNVQLAILLPKSFPDFTFDDLPPEKGFVFVSRELTHEETSVIHGTLKPFLVGLPLRVEVVVAPNRFVSAEAAVPEIPSSNGLNLLPARWLNPTTPIPIRQAVEEDDDFWASRHVEILSGPSADPKDWLGNGIPIDGSRCLIDASVLPPRNIRTSLALFRYVTLVAPLRDHHDIALKGLAISESDLIELAHRGRIQVLFPQPINRYSTGFLERLFELDSRPYILSRRLAAATVADARRRMPLLYPPVGVAERRILLELLQMVQDNAPAPWREGLITGLGESWTSAEYALHSKGAMATSLNGFGRILGEMVRRETGKDLLLELLFSSMPVEWAGALGATIMPVGLENEGPQKMAEFCASAYSGAVTGTQLASIGTVEAVLEEVLALEGDAPVRELDTAFSPRDISQLNDLVYGIVRGNLTGQDLRKAVRDLNDKVRYYNSSTKRVAWLNLMAPTGALATYALTGNPGGATFVGLGSWLLGLMVKDLDASRHPCGGLIDWVRSVNARTTPDVVLVSRLKKAIKEG
ncbi:hypothetical protein [Geothrix paludis]|uniref:hypothetical protein n=1 Tax=Geothrix paludis TaxID=2922722 RepID=UPI001FAD6BFD|nr:hypothetical protein [Geothrix paludis]